MPSHYTYNLTSKEKAEIVSVGSAGAGLTAILIGASLPIIGGVVGLIASAYMIAKNSKINKGITEEYFLKSKKDDTLEVIYKYDWLNDKYKVNLPNHLSLNDNGEKLTEYMKANPKSKIGIKNKEENSDTYLLYDITNKRDICELLSSPNYIDKLKKKYRISTDAPAPEQPSAPIDVPAEESSAPIEPEEEIEDEEEEDPVVPVPQSHRFKEYFNEKWKKLGEKKDELMENLSDKWSQYKTNMGDKWSKYKINMRDKKDDFIENIKSKIKERKQNKKLANITNSLKKLNETLDSCIIN